MDGRDRHRARGQEVSSAAGGQKITTTSLVSVRILFDSFKPAGRCSRCHPGRYSEEEDDSDKLVPKSLGIYDSDDRKITYVTITPI